MKDKDRGLGRGLEDLLAQNKMDLPFLSAYGPALEEDGEETSHTRDNPVEILEAMVRHARSLGAEVKMEKKSMSIESGLIATIQENGVLLEMSHTIRLPFVPSDLVSPGLTSGTINEQGCEAKTVIESWGIEARRTIARFLEHVEINLDE